MTTWYAQNSNVNIDSVNQWNDVANGSGNFLTWANLDPADILVANAKTNITCNVDFTCLRITTSNADGGTAGGGFLLAAGVTVTANVVAGTTTCLLAGDESFVVGDVTGGSGTSTFGAQNTSTGTITITGDVTGGSGGSAHGANNTSTGTITITGDVTGGSGANTFGARNASTGTLRVYGDAIGNDHGLGFSTNNSNPGVFGFGTNTGVNEATTTVGGLKFGAKGQSPVLGLVQLELGDPGDIEISFRRPPADAFAEYIVSASDVLGGQPTEADVRFATAYNFGTRTGTLIVPDPQYVNAGVPTDNTVGTLTAGLDESALHDALDNYTNKADWKATGFATAAALAVVDGVVDAVLVDTSTTLPAQIAGSGSGARTITITVTDGTDPLQNAKVRLTEGANTFTASTNVSGVATLNVDDATYTVAITKSSYSFAGASLVVDGDEVQVYAMTLVSVAPPTDPDLCAVTIPVVDQYGAALAGEDVEIRFNAFADNATATAVVLSPPPLQVSDANGLVSVNLLRLASYSVFYGEGTYKRRLDFSVPDAGSFTVSE